MLLAALFVPYLFILTPLRDTMILVKREMCGGNLDFAMASQTGILWTAATRAQAEEANLTYVEVGVQESAFPTTSNKITQASWLPSLEALRKRLTHTFSEAKVEPTPCIEAGVDAVFTSEYLLGIGYEVGKPGAKTCAELAYYCSDDAVEWSHHFVQMWLRLACPRTCGCTTPLASPLFKTPKFGCPKACIQESYGFSMWPSSPLYGKPPNFTTGCKDSPPGPGWHHFWDIYFPAVARYLDEELYRTHETYLGFAAWAKQVGCAALAAQPTDLTLGCSYHVVDPRPANVFLRTSRVLQSFIRLRMGGGLACRGSPFSLPLAWFCPETCGCKQSGNAERDHFCFGYDYCPMHVRPNETTEAWQLIQRYDLLKTFMNPALLAANDDDFTMSMDGG